MKIKKQTEELNEEIAQQNVDDNSSTTAPTSEVEKANEKKMSKLNKLSTIWTVISTIYAIITTISMLAKNWIQGTMANVLIVFLVVYIIVFLVLIALSRSNPEKIKGRMKTYKSLLGIFKGFANITFLVLSAVSMAGLAMEGNMALGEWAVFLTTLFVAVIKLAFKISSLIFKAYRKNIAKKYKVKITRYVDGKEQKKSTVDAINEKLYK